MVATPTRLIPILTPVTKLQRTVETRMKSLMEFFYLYSTMSWFFVDTVGQKVSEILHPLAFIYARFTMFGVESINLPKEITERKM